MEIEEPDGETILCLLKLIFEQLNTFIIILNKQKEVIWMNKAATTKAYTFSEENQGEKFLEEGTKAFWNQELDLSRKGPIDKAMIERKIIHSIVISPFSNQPYTLTCIPLLANGVTGTILLGAELNE